MRVNLKVLVVFAVFGLGGCTPALTIRPPQIDQKDLATRIAREPAVLERANNGDRRAQYIAGVNLYNGFTKAGKRDIEEALRFLVKSSSQKYMGATAFLGGGHYGNSALLKADAGRTDWAEDDQMADKLTQEALEQWEGAGRQGFHNDELISLQLAALTRGTRLKRIHKDNDAAFKYYCLALEIHKTPSAPRLNTIIGNLYNIDKEIADCNR